MMYHWFHELKKLPMKYDHYSFQEAIGIAYIEPQLGWSTRSLVKQKGLFQPSSTQEMTARSRKLTDKSLSPIEGQLKSQLKNSFPHLPVPVDKKNPTCQLYCWVHNACFGDAAASAPPRSHSNVMACES